MGEAKRKNVRLRLIYHEHDDKKIRILIRQIRFGYNMEDNIEYLLEKDRRKRSNVSKIIWEKQKF